MSIVFSAGQRWISDTESDLGLGTVLEAGHRQITVAFLSSGETRIYAKETAPLTRVSFVAGDIVESHEGWQLRITRVQETDGLLTYFGQREDTGESAALNEAGLNNFLQFRTPRDRLFAGLIDGQRWFSLRRKVFHHRHRLAQSPVKGLMGARVSILPHQVYIATEAMKRQHPRILLADEVGLGKTIEAGMILHAALINNQVSRVLIVVPSALLHQWLVEMLRKFNLKFSIMDAERFDELLESAPDGNPFLSEQLVLCAMDTLLDSREIGDAALSADWDMLITDEAHHLQWAPDAPSDAYSLIEELALETPSVLLLTATPEQLGQSGHFARLRLLDAERFSSLEQYVQEEAEFGWIAAVADKLADDKALGSDQIKQLEALLGKQFTEQETHTLGSSDVLAISDLGQQIIDKLVDRHGTGRLMFRNTRHAISGFPERRLNTYELTDDSLDSKALWLMEFLVDQYPAKVLVICSAKESVQAICEVLRVAGIQSAQFHENMSIVERDRAAAWFADTEEGCRLMVCSEIGSEGRNFQFLHNLVLLELPDSPDLLEQRIGRVDRIGQTQTIQIHIPVAKNSRDDILLNWYHKGLNAIERICKSGTAVRAELANPLNTLLEQEPHADAASVDQLIELTRTTTRRIDAELEAGRDRLLELNSNRPMQVQEHLDELARLDRNYGLQDFMDAVFDRFGIDVTEQRDHWIIHPGDHMQVDNFPHLPASGMTITFDRNTALAREDFTFLSWDHPMVTDSMDLILDESFGQADCQVIKAEELPKTLTLVETSYVLQCTADPALNIERYLPAQVQSYAIGIDGIDYTNIIANIELDSRKQRYNRNALRKVVIKNRVALENLMDKSAVMAEQALPDMLDKAKALLEQEYADARERLISLARVNPSVKDDEIEALDNKKTAMIEALSGTHARAISIRVLFNT